MPATWPDIEDYPVRRRQNFRETGWSVNGKYWAKDFPQSGEREVSIGFDVRDE
jgi:hypothetical protein